MISAGNTHENISHCAGMMVSVHLGWVEDCWVLAGLVVRGNVNTAWRLSLLPSIHCGERGRRQSLNIYARI